MKIPSKKVKNHANLRVYNSVRPDLAAPGPRKLRVVFPVFSVLPKPPQLSYGAKKQKKGVGWGVVGWGSQTCFFRCTDVAVLAVAIKRSVSRTARTQ